jgi:hypothetical protein
MSIKHAFCKLSFVLSLTIAALTSAAAPTAAHAQSSYCSSWDIANGCYQVQTRWNVTTCACPIGGKRAFNYSFSSE